MTILKLYIEMDNDAFAEEPLEEAARILRQQLLPRLDSGDVAGMLFDINGNSVGEYAVVPGGAK